MRAPLSGWRTANSSRVFIRPGISCSASSISLRPNVARPMSATLWSCVVAVAVIRLLGVSGGERRMRSYMEQARMLLLLEAEPVGRGAPGGAPARGPQPLLRVAPQAGLLAQAAGERDVGEADVMLGEQL